MIISRQLIRIELLERSGIQGGIRAAGTLNPLERLLRRAATGTPGVILFG
uniref:Uncharacterized protein n=1 Tax=Candidatus Kentrum sp. FW TaxID=2126338 RepID=A0A450U090_9GAMM|nr:MAG: hypothetical protein BECKFW1821C_GA0114237_108616 [Candidatus Kentron sp. FW]